jgi:hypothetical protein
LRFLLRGHLESYDPGRIVGNSEVTFRSTDTVNPAGMGRYGNLCQRAGSVTGTTISPSVRSEVRIWEVGTAMVLGSAICRPQYEWDLAAAKFSLLVARLPLV